MDKHHIVVLEGIHATMPPFSFPHTITIHQRTAPEQVAERIRDATIVIACVLPVTPADMDTAPHLGCLSVMAVGIHWVDKRDCAARNVTVTNCPAGNVDAVSEHFLGLYFATRKRIVQVHSKVTQTDEWREKGTLTKLWPTGPPLGCRQEVLAIMGYGTLGKRIAQLARAVGFGEVLASERKNADATAVREGRVSFDEALKRASVIGLCLPKENDTVDLIAEKELKMMRPDALVINVARGGIVNEAALATALREGWIAGAATDVLEIEPAGAGSGPLTPDPAKGEPPVPNLTISESNIPLTHQDWSAQKRDATALPSLLQLRRLTHPLSLNVEPDLHGS
jgi:glycerate dehydrogenase